MAIVLGIIAGVITAIPVSVVIYFAAEYLARPGGGRR
jgi:hypothetical protein